MSQGNALVLYRGREQLKLAWHDPRYRAGVVMESLEVRRVLSAANGTEDILCDQPSDPAIIVDDTSLETDWNQVIEGDEEIFQTTIIEPGDEGEVIEDWNDDGVIFIEDDGTLIEDWSDGEVIEDGDNGWIDEENGDPGTVDDGEVIDVPTISDDDLIFYTMGGPIKANQRDVEIAAGAGSPSPTTQADNAAALPPPVAANGAVEVADFSNLLGTSSDDVTEDGSASDLPFLA